MATEVNVDNFNAAETARLFAGMVATAGGVNRWFHYRAPTPADDQPVIRMNRDTLYSAAIVDISQGATLTLPDAGERYLSVMAVNAEHYINRVYRGAGEHEVTLAEHGTSYVLLAARTFVDPQDPADVAAVNALQDQLVVAAGSARDYTPEEYDEQSLGRTRDALLALGTGLPGTARMFGSPDEVDPVRHLIGTAVGWGGLPETEAFYYLETEPRPAVAHTMAFRDVPVDAFWSVTVYNRDGYLEPNPQGRFGINSVTGVREDDGSVVVRLGGDPDRPNHVPVVDGWNYAIRLYRPRPEVVDGSWAPPVPEPA